MSDGTEHLIREPGMVHIIPKSREQELIEAQAARIAFYEQLVIKLIALLEERRA